MNYRLLIRIPTALIVISKMLFVVCLVAHAEAPAGLPPEVEAAQLRIKLYQGQEYPLQRRILESKIRVAKARVASFERQREEYDQFTKFQHSSPLFGQIEFVKIAQVAAEEELKTLSQEKSLLERFHQDKVRLLELELELARRPYR